MALKLQVQEIARRQGIENAAQLAKLTGLGLPSCYQLWKGTARAISLKTLNTLCNKLRTHPAILFDYKPDPEEGSSVVIKSSKRRNR
jgi:DNA-binding Xre family transcriptional regulator